jgi:hypothetical protein
MEHFFFRDPSLSDEENTLAAARYLLRFSCGEERLDQERFDAALAALDRAGFTGSPLVC